jgi:hypothetical protein
MADPLSPDATREELGHAAEVGIPIEEESLPGGGDRFDIVLATNSGIDCPIGPGGER